MGVCLVHSILPVLCGELVLKPMEIAYADFTERAVRARFIVQRFAPYLKGRVLDVGCDKAILKAMLADVDYVGIDVGGTPDLVVDLERVEQLPFESGAFDVVVCADVLEHLTTLHHVFDDLLRVARSTVIVSLPNNWANARRPIQRGKGHIGHYGLPVDPPIDRHKWFFSLEEAQAFLSGRAARNGAQVRNWLAVEKPRLLVQRWIRRLAYPSELPYLNRYAHTLFAVLQKPSTAS